MIAAAEPKPKRLRRVPSSVTESDAKPRRARKPAVVKVEAKAPAAVPKPAARKARAATKVPVPVAILPKPRAATPALRKPAKAVVKKPVETAATKKLAPKRRAKAQGDLLPVGE